MRQPPEETAAQEASNLFQTAPERIWLQVDPDGSDFEATFPYNGEVSWCHESIGGEEVTYIRTDIYKASVARLEQALSDAGQELSEVKKQRNDVGDLLIRAAFILFVNPHEAAYMLSLIGDEFFGEDDMSDPTNVVKVTELRKRAQEALAEARENALAEIVKRAESYARTFADQDCANALYAFAEAIRQLSAPASGDGAITGDK